MTAAATAMMSKSKNSSVFGEDLLVGTFPLKCGQGSPEKQNGLSKGCHFARTEVKPANHRSSV